MNDANDAPDKRLPVAKLRALCWAEHHMIEAREGCAHLASLPADLGAHLEACITTGIIVAYARPFTENLGLSALGARYREFSDPDFKRLHDTLLEMRNMVYSHLDVVTEPKHAKTGLSIDERRRIAILIDREGGGKWRIMRGRLGRETFPFVQTLCEHQKERFHAESTGLLIHLTEGKAYAPGEYSLGVDFP